MYEHLHDDIVCLIDRMMLLGLTWLSVCFSVFGELCEFALKRSCHDTCAYVHSIHIHAFGCVL